MGAVSGRNLAAVSLTNDSSLELGHDPDRRLDERSILLRRLVVRTLDGGARGHIGSSMSLIEILRGLYDDIFRYRADDPDWLDRHPCILSQRDGCLSQYVMLAQKGVFSYSVLGTVCRCE